VGKNGGSRATRKAPARQADGRTGAERLDDSPLFGPFEPWGAERPVPLPYMGDSPDATERGVVATLPSGSGEGGGLRLGSPLMILGLAPLVVLLGARALLAWWHRGERYY
jgi:hypothetical protein